MEADLEDIPSPLVSTTSSSVSGADVPIPTLPPEAMLNLCSEFVRSCMAN